jgi:hypothetical protein
VVIEAEAVQLAKWQWLMTGFKYGQKPQNIVMVNERI